MLLYHKGALFSFINTYINISSVYLTIVIIKKQYPCQQYPSTQPLLFDCKLQNEMNSPYFKQTYIPTFF